MPYLHFTVAVEYKFGKRVGSEALTQIARQIEESLVRHADVVAVHRAFEAKDPKAKIRVLPVAQQPELRGENGWHRHDNDSACTPCMRLYEYVHEDTL